MLVQEGGCRASKRCVGAAFGTSTEQGAQPDLLGDFGGLLEKHLFLGRTLLLRLQGNQTCVCAGMLAPGLPNAMLMQHFVLGVFPHLFSDFGGLLEKHLF